MEAPFGSQVGNLGPNDLFFGVPKTMPTMDLQLAHRSGKIRGFRAAKLSCSSAQLIDGIDVTSPFPSLGRRASEGTSAFLPRLRVGLVSICRYFSAE